MKISGHTFRWRLLLPLALVTAMSGFYLYSFIGMSVCRPTQQYDREHRILTSLHRGQPRVDAEPLLNAAFVLIASNEDEATFTSRIDLPAECLRYPVMVNVVVVTYEDDRIADVQWHDEATWPLLEAALRRLIVRRS